MAKAADAFRTISEVADWLGVPAHVLRFWESKFPQIKPVKRAGGRRYYRPEDMRLLGGIKSLLHDQGMTIKAAQQFLREHGVQEVAGRSQPLEDPDQQPPITGSVGPAILRSSSATPAANSGVVDFPPKTRATRKTAKDTTETTAHIPEQAPETPPDLQDSVDPPAAQQIDTAPNATPDPAPTADTQPGPVPATPDQPEPTIPDAAAPTDDAAATSPPTAAPLKDKTAPDVEPSTMPGSPDMPKAPEPLQDLTVSDIQHNTPDAPDPDTAPDTPPAGPEATRPVRPDLPAELLDDPEDMPEAAPGILCALTRLPRDLSRDRVDQLVVLRDRLAALHETNPAQQKPRDG